MTQSEQVREKLIQAAGPVFAEHGYQLATVREICAAAGANVASINYYFGDKQKLYIAAVHYARQQRATQFPLRDRDEQASPIERLHNFITTLLHRMLDDGEAPWHVRLMVREVLQPTAACREMVDEYFRPQCEILQSIIQDLVATKLDKLNLARLSFSIIGQCFFYRVAGQVVDWVTADLPQSPHGSLDDLAEHITRFSLAAIQAYQQTTLTTPQVLGNVASAT